MKKSLFLTYSFVACLLFSCQQKPAETQREQKPVEQPTQTKDMQSFAQQKGCFACHDINTRKVGPAFKEVAKKLAGERDAEVHLAERIRKGGVGEWGNVPMPPQNVTEQEAKDLAKWVLSLK
ncbi:MAG: c-type cytochrome [Aquificaceae bacterium]